MCLVVKLEVSEDVQVRGRLLDVPRRSNVAQTSRERVKGGVLMHDAVRVVFVKLETLGQRKRAAVGLRVGTPTDLPPSTRIWVYKRNDMTLKHSHYMHTGSQNGWRCTAYMRGTALEAGASGFQHVKDDTSSAFIDLTDPCYLFIVLAARDNDVVIDVLHTCITCIRAGLKALVLFDPSLSRRFRPSTTPTNITFLRIHHTSKVRCLVGSGIPLD